MKILFASDIHGSLYYAKKVFEKFEQEKCDQIVFLGDLLYHGPRNDLPKDYSPKEVSALLNSYKDKIITVRGNCDSEVDQMMLEFPILATYGLLMVDGHRFYLTHGHIFNKDNLPPLVENEILTYGHFHVPLLEKQDNHYIFNPSSASLPKAGVNSYGIYEEHKLYIKDFEGNIVKSLDLK